MGTLPDEPTDGGGADRPPVGKTCDGRLFLRKMLAWPPEATARQLRRKRLVQDWAAAQAAAAARGGRPHVGSTQVRLQPRRPPGPRPAQLAGAIRQMLALGHQFGETSENFVEIAGVMAGALIGRSGLHSRRGAPLA